MFEYRLQIYNKETNERLDNVWFNSLMQVYKYLVNYYEFKLPFNRFKEIYNSNFYLYDKYQVVIKAYR